MGLRNEPYTALSMGSIVALSELALYGLLEPMPWTNSFGAYSLSPYRGLMAGMPFQKCSS